MTERVARLRLVASSVAGRPLEVAVGDPGALASTDGRTIFLDPMADARAQLQALAVQASLLAAGSLDVGVARELLRRPALTRRYLAIEAPRALRANDERLPAAARALIARVDVLSAGSPADSLGAARAMKGEPDLPAVFGELVPRALLEGTEPLQATSAEPLGARPRPPGTTDDLDGDEAVDDDVFSMLSDLSGAGGAIGRFLQRFMTAHRQKGSGPLGADAPARGRVVAGVPGRAARGAAGALPTTADVAARTGGRTYPEWDGDRRAYRADWCTVVEEDPVGARAVPRARTSSALRRPLSQLGLGLVPTRRRPQGEDIDLDAAIEAHVEKRAGTHADEAIYTESLRRRHELAVLILIDVSGSTNEPSAGGRTVHDQQVEAAEALAETFHAFGNRTAVYGFFSQGRNAVRMVRVKRFADAMDARARTRLGALTPGAYTRLGAAIRHGSALLDEDGAGARSLLIVLSDGFAYDHGYQGSYGEADARRALVEARRQGIGCLCLSIGTTTDLTALRRVFGSAAHGVLRRPSDLATSIGPLMRDALRSADRQRSTNDKRITTENRRVAAGRRSA